MASPGTAAATKKLSLVGFFAITASMVMAVYEYPTFATSGFSLVFFLLLGGILWCIPVALCAAEMATVEGWEEGGVFGWVSNSLGERWGFAAISFTFLEICVGFIPMLYFIMGALSHLLGWPELNTNPILKTVIGLIILWGLAFTQFGGTEYTAKIAKVGFFAGILLPALILVGLAIAFLSSGQPLAIPLTAETFFPDFTKLGTLVVFVAFILSYMGIEASATHVNEMENPGRDYPLAIFILVIVAIFLSSFGGLAIATTIKPSEINLAAGVFQAYAVLVNHFGEGFGWVVRVLALLLMLGVLAEIASWIVGPSRGMLVTAQKGLLPQKLAHVNKHGVPVALVITQLIITSVALIVLTNLGGGSNISFLIAMALTVVLYLWTYFLLFVGYIHLVTKQKDKKRAFHVPGSTGFKVAIAVIGLIVSIGAFLISFVPPALPGSEDPSSYVILLIIAFLVVFSIPFIMYAVHNKHGKTVNFRLRHIKPHNAPEGHRTTRPRARATHHVEPLDQPVPITDSQHTS